MRYLIFNRVMFLSLMRIFYFLPASPNYTGKSNSRMPRLKTDDCAEKWARGRCCPASFQLPLIALPMATRIARCQREIIQVSSRFRAAFQKKSPCPFLSGGRGTLRASHRSRSCTVHVFKRATGIRVFLRLSFRSAPRLSC